MYIGNFWREREKASSNVKVLIRRRQRRMEREELRHELIILASDLSTLHAFLTIERDNLPHGAESAFRVAQRYPSEIHATPVA